MGARLWVTLRPAKNGTLYFCVQTDWFATCRSCRSAFYALQMYPLDRRKLAAHVYGLLHSLRKTAVILQVGHSTVARWLKSPSKKLYPQRPSKAQQLAPALRAMVLADPFMSLCSLQKRVLSTFGFSVSKELLRVALKRGGLSKKKAKFFSRPAGLEQTTQAFLVARDKYIAEGRLFVSLDETSFGRHGCEVRGYAPVGQLLTIRKARPRVTTVSCLAAVTRETVLAREQVVGAFNTARFLDFMQRLQLPAGTVFLLDNVRFHHANAVKDLARQRQWTLLYTPPYSPWYNPIEGVFSVVKRAYYKGCSIDECFATVTRSHLAAFMDKSISLRNMPC